MSASQKFVSNFKTGITRTPISYIILVIYETEQQKPCQLATKRVKKSQILTVTPDQLNIDTIWGLLNVDDSKLTDWVITGIQVIDKTEEIIQEGTLDDYEFSNVDVDNNVDVTVTNKINATVDGSVNANITNTPNVRVTNLP